MRRMSPSCVRSVAGKRIPVLVHNSRRPPLRKLQRNMSGRWTTRVRYSVVIVVAMILAATASQDAQSSERAGYRDAVRRAADHALKMVNAPYRFGGSHPSTGFDCSGLVQFSYRQAGLAVPRSTDEQRRASRPVGLADLTPGDLVFFDQEGKKNSHVGIYVGKGRFVHAPSSGKRVRSDELKVPYWRKHISEARRFNV